MISALLRGRPVRSNLQNEYITRSYCCSVSVIRYALHNIVAITATMRVQSIFEGIVGDAFAFILRIKHGKTVVSPSLSSLSHEFVHCWSPSVLPSIRADVSLDMHLDMWNKTAVL